nr:MAG TPA: hypothetical protein [Caudoviricetes sp.]
MIAILIIISSSLFTERPFSRATTLNFSKIVRSTRNGYGLACAIPPPPCLFDIKSISDRLLQSKYSKRYQKDVDTAGVVRYHIDIYREEVPKWYDS